MTAFQAVYVGSIPITRFAETLVYQGFFLFLLRVTTGYRLILFVFPAIKGMPHCEASLFSSLNLYFVLFPLLDKHSICIDRMTVRCRSIPEKRSSRKAISALYREEIGLSLYCIPSGIHISEVPVMLRVEIIRIAVGKGSVNTSRILLVWMSKPQRQVPKQHGKVTKYPLLLQVIIAFQGCTR